MVVNQFDSVGVNNAFHFFVISILLRKCLIFNADTDAIEGCIKIIEPIKLIGCL